MFCPQNLIFSQLNDLFNDIINEVKNLNVGGLWFHSVGKYHVYPIPHLFFQKWYTNSILSYQQKILKDFYISKLLLTKHVSWIAPPYQL